MKSRALLLALLGGFLMVGSVLAHADYERSEPGSGAVVAEAPDRVVIWFTQELFRRQGENWIRVFGPDGEPVHAGEAFIDDDDRAHMWVKLEGDLPAGAYRVEWRTLSAEDGDTEEGSFSFTVDPQAAATSTPMREVTPTVAPTAPAVANTPTVATESDGASATGCAFGLLPAAALIGWGFRRRQRWDD